MLSKGFATVGLLLVSNVFMTLAWYAHLKLQSAKLISNWPLYTVVLFSWAIALLEYSFMVPANRIGFEGNGGPFSLIQLKIIQEVITLTVFTLFSVIAFQQHLAWNHFAAFACLVAAVYFVARTALFILRCRMQQPYGTISSTSSFLTGRTRSSRFTPR